MEHTFSDGFLVEEAHVRFSDFSANGTLQNSKCLMYFEKSRFAISDISGIYNVIRAENSASEIAVVVTKIDLSYLQAVSLENNDYNRKLIVKTKLITPVISKLSFIQQLVDEKTGCVLVEGLIDTIFLRDGKIMMDYSDNARKCLEKYIDLAQSDINTH